MIGLSAAFAKKNAWSELFQRLGFGGWLDVYTDCSSSF